MTGQRILGRIITADAVKKPLRYLRKVFPMVFMAHARHIVSAVSTWDCPGVGFKNKSEYKKTQKAHSLSQRRWLKQHS